MHYVYVIVSRIYGRLFWYLMNSKSDATCTRTYLLMRKTMPHVYVIVSRIYGRLFLYPMNSKSNATCTRTYLLMRKQCLMFVLLLAVSERAVKNPLKIKFRKDVVESYKPIVWAEPRPISMCRMPVICRITTYFYLTCSFAVWVCTLEPRQP